MDMDSTGVKFSGGKIVPHSVLRGDDDFRESMAEVQTQGHIPRNMECKDIIYYVVGHQKY